MSNVIAFQDHRLRRTGKSRPAGHAALFSEHRRDQADVFWLKENAEFLNILAATGADADGVLGGYEDIYDRIDAQIGQYPQYYRFLLSICLDLEDLGMPGRKGRAMCKWVAEEGLAEAELSDLQRAEASRLLRRRGVAVDDPALRQRLHRFIDRNATFGVPNKKAAYELTHIVFYLSDYGQRDPGISASAIRSLTYAGLVALLDQDHDLLAEVCVALRYAGQAPDARWQTSVLGALQGAQVEDAAGKGGFDDYHTYLVCGWYAGLIGRDPFPLVLPDGPAQIWMGRPAARPLRDLGLALAEERRADWNAVRASMISRLSPAAADVLICAEESASCFEDFYAQFARVSSPAP